jgi:phosphate transport system protein
MTTCCFLVTGNVPARSVTIQDEVPEADATQASRAGWCAIVTSVEGQEAIMRAADFSPHTSRSYNQDLERVRGKLLEMGDYVAKQLGNAVFSLVEADIAVGRAVASGDREVNRMELSIDEECSRILATRAPTASDLRVVIATIKAGSDLERIGDECQKLGYIAAKLATLERDPARYCEVDQLGQAVKAMLHDTLAAFAHLDATGALKACRMDRAIDEQYKSIHRDCVTAIAAVPGSIHTTLEIIWAVRALERIGDHAKNICEYVIYVVHGKDVRHASLEHLDGEWR